MMRLMPKMLPPPARSARCGACSRTRARVKGARGRVVRSSAAFRDIALRRARSSPYRRSHGLITSRLKIARSEVKRGGRVLPIARALKCTACGSSSAVTEVYVFEIVSVRVAFFPVIIAARFFTPYFRFHVHSARTDGNGQQ